MIRICYVLISYTCDYASSRCTRTRACTYMCAYVYEIIPTAARGMDVIPILLTRKHAREKDKEATGSRSQEGTRPFCEGCPPNCPRGGGGVCGMCVRPGSHRGIQTTRKDLGLSVAPTTSVKKKTPHDFRL